MATFLALAPTAFAAKAPPLAATAHYKALVDYVKKYDAQLKEQAAIVRNIEDDELEAVAADFAAKLDRASASYQLMLSRITHAARPSKRPSTQSVKSWP